MPPVTAPLLDSTRKAIAQGMSDCLRCPVCSCAHSSTHCARDLGCSAHPAFPAPSRFREVAKITCKPRAQCAAGMRSRVFRHCDLSAEALARAEAIHLAVQRKNGLLRRFAPLRKRFAFVAGNDGLVV